MTVHSIRVLVPMDTARFAAGHEALDYEVSGLIHGQKSTLASVKNGKHPKTEPGPLPGTHWIVVKLDTPKILDGVRMTCKRTSGINLGPVIFESS